MLPAIISVGLSALQSAVSAAGPIESAPALQVASIVQHGRDLLSAIDAAGAAPGAVLDAANPSGFAGAFPDALNALGEAANDASRISDLRGYVGRAVFNLSQAR